MIRKVPISKLMTKHVITLEKADALEKAERLFKLHKIRHIPVVDNHAIVGILSYSDLLRLSFADITDDMDRSADAMVYNMLSVGQVMKQNIVTVSPFDSIKKVAKILATKEFHALPVVDKRVLVGIVTTTDLIKYLLKQL